MSSESVHPLELEFLEAIQFLEESIAAARAASAAVGSGDYMNGANIYHHQRREFGFVWVPGVGQSFGPPGADVTHLAYPWDDPRGWGVAHSGE